MTAIPPVDGLTIGAALHRAARRQPDRQGLVFSQAGFRVTYAEYDACVDEVARSLLALDVRRGDHVAVWATNWPEWTLLFMAAARIGAVLVTVNPAYRTHELAYALRQSDAKALFLIDRFKSSDYFGMIAEVRDGLSELRFVVSMKPHAAPGILPWADFLALGRTVPTAEVRRQESRLSPDDPINLQYTSGTTGFPKGVLLSHRSLLLNAWYVGESQRLGPDDRVCVPVPFYHCFGIVIGTLCCMVHECTMLVPAEYFGPLEVLDSVESEMPEATAQAILEGGWLRTGDLAVRQGDGCYRITGRIKDMIIRGGENIYPREIEEFLYTHPAVESAQAVGVPDRRFGEEVCVWIKLRRDATATADEVRAFCKERLAHFKVPRYVKFVDDFPLTVTGKVQKFRIREMAIEELGLAEGHGDVAFDDAAPDATDTEPVRSTP